MNLWGESGLPVLFLRHLGPVVKTPLQKGMCILSLAWEIRSHMQSVAKKLKIIALFCWYLQHMPSLPMGDPASGHYNQRDLRRLDFSPFFR